MATDCPLSPRTPKVPSSLFKENQKRLASQLKSGQIVVLQGGEDIPYYNTDVEYLFRQEGYFTWICGVRLPGYYFALDVSTGKAHLFVPYISEENQMWMGKPPTFDDFRKNNGVDEVHYVKELCKVLQHLKPEVLLLLMGINSDSKVTTKETYFEGIKKFKVDSEILFPIITELRVFKTPEEITLLRYVCKVSSDAHKQVMLYTKPGLREYQCESVFLDFCYREGGCRYVAYTCVCCSGSNAAILHYGDAGHPNSKCIENGDMCLFDMGGSYAGYAADITCSFPANGKFTDDQRLVYEAVLAARDVVMREAKPGVMWLDMHLKANRVMLEHLTKGNMLVGDVEKMMEAGINCILQPHGLGHLIGLDVHDVGGYLPHCPPRPKPPLNRLRTARMLQAGMMITIEPGCYFIKPLLERALANPDQKDFFNDAMIRRFFEFGGVRIEDDV
ncbi:xaa-Pro dipeptidase-like, partial [Hyposmocoma kahamanoa]|uniref:xaa-Pro dipeptidase-like n=1 Tax=Hyposmocoma kahamanoa TaxID=1477025 RepID=UPI000E6D91EC